MPANRPTQRPNALNGFAGFRVGIIGLSRASFLLLSSVSAAPMTYSSAHHEHVELEAAGSTLWVLYLASVILVLLGGAFAGLTIALMGQDYIYLQVLSGDPYEPQSKNARSVYSLLRRGKHWVLVTLLLGNVIVNETLPVVLDRCLGGGVAAVIGSTVLIVIFGEILPQSVCVRYGLPIGGYMARPVLLLMWLMAPIAWPTAKLLDWALGEDHGTVYKKSGLKTLVTLHQSLGDVSERLNEDEVTIISAVLDLKEKPVETVMTPMDDVFVMSEDTVLNEKTMDRILSEGYSRIPIHAPGNRSNFVGMLLVKILITYDPEDCMKVKDFPLATLPETRPETSCLDIVNFFQQGKSHMVLVSEYPGEDHGALGVVTLEDVIEELIGEEIIDESDVYIDVHKAIRRLTPAPKARLARRESNADGVADKPAEESGVLDFRDVVQQLPKRWGSVSAQSDAPRLSSSPKTATFMMRRLSAGPDGRPTGAIPVKANLDEMRDHLKHLGPSNPATNPKNTKFRMVKIKGLPSTGGQPGAALTLSPSSAGGDGHEEPEDDDAGDETTPFIQPKLSGKKGVHAVRRSYGGTGMSDAQARLAIPSEDADADTVEPQDGKKNGKEPETVGSEPQTQSHRSELGGLNSHHDSNESLGSLSKSSGVNTSRRRPYVRSGSITENIFETGGVQKIVIQTASSEDEEAETPRSGKPSPPEGSPADASPVAQTKASSTVEARDSDTEEADNEPQSPVEHDGPSSSSNLAHTSSGSGGAGQNVKKKNRRKKRKGSSHRR